MSRPYLVDGDGENRAVRTFLMQYSCDRAITIGQMRDHMELSGWEGMWPEFVTLAHADTYLTKMGAQSWIRHLIGLEPAAALTATHGPLRMTNLKTGDIAGRGYNIVGYVLRSGDEKEVCISAESAVRWLPQENYWRLMHEQDGSLFGPAPAVKDHVVREAVNQLTQVAKDFHATGQLRSRIQDVILPLLKPEGPK